MRALTDGAEDSGARGDELEARAASFGADFELLPFEMGAVARVAIALESETAKAALEARARERRAETKRGEEEYATYLREKAGAADAATRHAVFSLSETCPDMSRTCPRHVS